MALLIYSRGLDVRVTTIGDNEELYRMTVVGRAVPVQWDDPKDEAQTLREQLEKVNEENAILRQRIENAYRTLTS